MTTEKTDVRPTQTYIEQHDLKADWDYWSKATTWTVIEAAFLISGIEPSKLLIDGVNHIETGLSYGLIEFKDAKKNLELLQRANNDGLIGDRNQPLAILNHCDSYQIKVPLELRRIVLDATTKQVEFAEKIQGIREARQIKSKASTNTKAEESHETAENRLLLIGVMSKMLQDKKLTSHFPFQDQQALSDYIHNNYREIYPAKGLSSSKIKRILGQANKIMKEKV